MGRLIQPWYLLLEKQKSDIQKILSNNWIPLKGGLVVKACVTQNVDALAINTGCINKW